MYGGVLESKLLSLAKPGFREDFLIMIRTGVDQYIFCRFEIIAMTHLVHLADQTVAQSASEEKR